MISHLNLIDLKNKLGKFVTILEILAILAAILFIMWVITHPESIGQQVSIWFSRFLEGFGDQEELNKLKK